MILSAPIRRKMRLLRGRLSLLKQGLQRRPGGDPPLKIQSLSPPSGRLRHPAIRIVPPPGINTAEFLVRMEAQSETSWTLADESNPAFLYCPDSLEEALPPTLLESLLLIASICDSDFALGDTGEDRPEADTLLLRRLNPVSLDRDVVGRLLSFSSSGGSMRFPLLPGFGGSVYRESGGKVLKMPLIDPELLLADLPEIHASRTAVFVLPFLAVGGAEKLLFDLMDGLSDAYRLLVVTLEEARPELGSSLDACARHTPLIYSLGDWLPREARIPALRHLLRRHRAEALISWNGCIDFYDGVEAICRDFPDLRVYDQHYNHEGAWLEWLDLEKISGMAGHIAVNSRIATALEDRGAKRVHTIPHAVVLPGLPDADARRELRRCRREELGIPIDKILVGSFIRLHPQKRPLDILEVAARMEGRGYHFLLVGGGPEELRVKAALAQRPQRNLSLLPMQQDTGRLFEALDICLLASAYEGLPVFLLEGLAREIPCVAPNVGKIGALFSEGGGILVDRPGDFSAFERALESLRDPEKRRREGLRGREHVARFHSLKRYCRAYESVVFPG